MNDDELLRYSRHILLNEIGIEGQEKLLLSHALIIGCGGLGCAAALYLASSGVSRITLVDDDTVDITNLQRQIAHTIERVHQPKVNSLAQAIHAINPSTHVSALPTRASPALLNNLLGPEQSAGNDSAEYNTARDAFTKGGERVNVVLDCSDNFATRHAINAACNLARVPLVSGSALGMDAQLSVFDARVASSACYACIFPIEEPPEEQSCATMGVFAPLVGIIGAAQAAEALKLLMQIGEPLVGKLMMFNATQFRWSEIRVQRSPRCTVCSQPALLQD